jgi:hypothetical protein
MTNEIEINRWLRHNENCTLVALVEVENSKIYGYSYDSLCASDSDTVNFLYRL